MAEIAAKIFTIEILPELVNYSNQNLSQYKNIYQYCGDGWNGYESESPYDRILVAAAPDAIPEKLTGQLAEGGIMVLPVGKRFNQRLLQIKKVNDELRERFVCGVVFVPLVHGNDL